MDIEPLKGLSDSESKDDEYNQSSLDGERFGTLFALGIAVFLFFVFLVGAIR